MSHLLETFNRHFDVVLVDNKALLDEAYRIRYQVYCEENDFEDASNLINNQEVDAYDDRSVHSLVRHRESGHFAGVVRLILPKRYLYEQPLPAEVYCWPHFKRSCLEDKQLRWHGFSEISRFAVSAEFKRRLTASTLLPKGERMFKNSAFDSRLLPHITLGLFSGIVRLSVKHRVSHCLAMMEPTLLRLLTRFGIHFKAVGSEVFHHGKRLPVFASVEEVLNEVYTQRRDVWEMITNNGRTLVGSDFISESDVRVCELEL